MFHPRTIPFYLILHSALAVLTLIRPANASPSPGLNFDMREYERARVLKAADQYLQQAPVTITSFPATRSAGGLHDYYSEADYYWPDPKNPQGPYIDRDGMSNPGNFNDHRLALRRMSIQVGALTAAYVITGNKRYADHAIDHLRAWFITPATKMNPNLLYSQAIRNKVTGRSIGIIDTLHLVEVARSVVVLRQRGALSPRDAAGLTGWFDAYVRWMTTHPYGIEEGNAPNNHATCYWLQVAAFATVAGNPVLLDQCRERYKQQLLPQMAPDGSFPKELHRTKPYGYSLFNLDQMVTLCRILSTPKDNLWNYTLPGGQNIHKGTEYMYPYVKDKSKWPLPPDVMVYRFWPVRSPAWLFAGIAFHEQKYIDLWKSLNPDPVNEEILRNLPLHQPVLWVE
ncbi:MAG TPA: alginate lyase family protein [Candidatus Methylacidiphilales bacterium]|nr:alginate lyase family protein [Candidatus Methylacidiphilales bacterium]